MYHFPRKAAVVLGLATLSTLAVAGMVNHTKDIVIDSVTSAASSPATASADTMSLSVLLESPDGSLTPRSTDKLFRTGDRFRVKVLASRAGKISLYNTNPRGETTATPIWQGEVKVGQELVTPRLALQGHSGIDQLHVLLEPTQAPSSVHAWLSQWLQSFKAEGGSKDIRVDVQSTDTHTYLVNPVAGQGLVSTIQIAHATR